MMPSSSPPLLRVATTTAPFQLNSVFPNNELLQRWYTLPIQQALSNAGLLQEIGCVGECLPFTVSKPQSCQHQVYFTSIRGHFVDYATDEIKFHAHGFLRVFGLGIVQMLACFIWILRIGPCVQVNNLFVSTNVYVNGAKDAETALATCKVLAARYPNHAIVWRTLDRYGTTKPLLQALEPKTHLVFSRLVNYFDPTNKPAWARDSCMTDMRQLCRLAGLNKQDIRLVQQGQLDLRQALANASSSPAPYELVYLDPVASRLEPGYFERLEHLYASLYLDKYSKSNPVYTASYLQHAMETGIWEFCVAKRRNDGVVDGVMAVR
jgi:hypothetical protein